MAYRSKIKYTTAQKKYMWDRWLQGDMLKKGKIVAPEELGIGIEIYWDTLSTADFYRSSK